MYSEPLEENILIIGFCPPNKSSPLYLDEQIDLTFQE